MLHLRMKKKGINALIYHIIKISLPFINPNVGGSLSCCSFDSFLISQVHTPKSLWFFNNFTLFTVEISKIYCIIKLAVEWVCTTRSSSLTVIVLYIQGMRIALEGKYKIRFNHCLLRDIFAFSNTLNFLLYNEFSELCTIYRN